MLSFIFVTLIVIFVNKTISQTQHKSALPTVLASQFLTDYLTVQFRVS